MSYMRFNFKSQAVGCNVDVGVVIPLENYFYYDASKGLKHHLPPDATVLPPLKPGMKFQTVYFLHGGGEDDTVPFRFTNLEWYAIKNNVMVVAPNIGNSFGADTNYGANYGTFINEELPCVIRALFPSSEKREDNYIVGYAMGGNAVLSAAIMHPENYSVCVDMSGGIGYTLCTDTLKQELNSDHFRKSFKIYNATFGEADELEGSRHDCWPRPRSGRFWAGRSGGRHVKKKHPGCCLPNFILFAAVMSL